MTTTEEGSNGVAEFVATLIPALVVATIFLILFVVLRERRRNVYAPRASWLKNAYKAPSLPPGPVAWVRAVWDVPEEYVIENVGMDAAVFLRVFKMAVQLFSTCSVFAIAVLATNASAENGLDGLSGLSMANVEDGSALMWVHTVAMWGISLVAWYTLAKNYDEILRLSQDYKAAHMDNYSVLVRNLPEELRSTAALREYFGRLYPADFHDAVASRDVGDLAGKVDEYANLSRQLDHARAVWAEEQASGKPADEVQRPQVRDGKVPCLAPKVDAIEHLEKRTAELRAEIEAARQGDLKGSTAGFVTFRKLAAASSAAQVVHAVKPGTVLTDLAPEPREIYWPGVLMPPLVRATQGNIVALLTAGLSVGYIFPIVFVAGLGDLDALSETGGLGWLSFVSDLPPAVRGLIQGLLPVVMLAVLMALIPIILRQFAQREGAVSESAIQSRIFGSYYAFQVVFVFFFTMLAKSLFKKLNEVIDDPGSIFSLLGESVPAAGNFFIGYVTLQALGQFPGELVRIAPLILTHIKLKMAKTDAERMEIMEPGSIDYGTMLPQHLIIYLVCLAYAVVHPIISLFALVYFGMGYVTWKHQVLMVYTPIAESGGANWHRIFKFICVGIAISQATLVGVVALKQGVSMGPFLLPLPFLTFFFYSHFAKLYSEAISSKKLSREVARRVDEEKGENPTEADLVVMHKAFRHPALVYNLDDILYQTSGRSKSAANLANLPPRDTWVIRDDDDNGASDRSESDEHAAASSMANVLENGSGAAPAGAAGAADVTLEPKRSGKENSGSVSEH